MAAVAFRRARLFAGIVGLAGVTACASRGPATPAAFPGASRPAASMETAAPAVAAAIEAALQLRGTPYVFGGSDPGSGFDCSGLIQHVFALAGVTLPRVVSEQAHVGRAIGRDRLQAGDLVFFKITGSDVSHVGLMIDEAQFVHAPAERGAVRIESIAAPYWDARFAGGRRVAVASRGAPR